MDFSKEIECKEVIISRILRRGTGKDENDPIRIITQVFEKDGTLIAESDPCTVTAEEHHRSLATMEAYYKSILSPAEVNTTPDPTPSSFNPNEWIPIETVLNFVRKYLTNQANLPPSKAYWAIRDKIVEWRNSSPITPSPNH